jgi:membrane-bound lytic murein transglycosylase A
MVHHTMKINKNTASAASKRKIHIGVIMLAAACLASCSGVKRPAPFVAAPEAASETALAPVQFTDLPGWSEDSTAQVWPVLKQNCTALKNRPEWREACAAASALDALSDEKPSDEQAKEFFSTWFTPWRVRNADGNTSGLITGYYEPVLLGSRTRKPGFTVPLHGLPKNYSRDALGFTRAELLNGNGALSLRGRELAWVNDAVDAFFLQVQGSGRIQLEDGTQLRLGYAGSNGHPYRSIGKALVERGEMTLDQASMQSIKRWAQANPEQLPGLLAENPSYIFFRELPAASAGVGPIGSLGVPLTAERSIAVDPRSIALGTPVFLSTTQPLSGQPLQRLVVAQDTGSAIKGAVRADFFWGSGAPAGELAGRMKQSVEMWVLLPKR